MPLWGQWLKNVEQILIYRANELKKKTHYNEACFFHLVKSVTSCLPIEGKKTRVWTPMRKMGLTLADCYGVYENMQQGQWRHRCYKMHFRTTSTMSKHGFFSIPKPMEYTGMVLGKLDHLPAIAKNARFTCALSLSWGMWIQRRAIRIIASDTLFTILDTEARCVPMISPIIRKKHPLAAHSKNMHSCTTGGTNGPRGSPRSSSFTTSKTVSFRNRKRSRKPSSLNVSNGFNLSMITRGTGGLIACWRRWRRRNLRTAAIFKCH